MEQNKKSNEGEILWTIEKLQHNMSLAFEDDKLRPHLEALPLGVYNVLVEASAKRALDAISDVNDKRRAHFELELNKVNSSLGGKITALEMSNSALIEENRQLLEKAAQFGEQQNANQREHEKLDLKIKESESKKGILQQENSNLKCSLHEVKATNSELAKNLGTVEANLKNLQKSLQASEEEKKTILKEKEEAVEKLRNLEGEVLQLTSANEEAVEHMLDLEMQLLESEQEKEEQKASFESEIKNLNARNSELAMNLETAEEKLKNLQDSLQKSEEQKRVIQRDKEDALGKLQDLVVQLTSGNEKLHMELGDLKKKNEEVNGWNTALESEVNVVKERESELKKKIELMTTEGKKLQEKLANLEEQRKKDSQKAVEHMLDLEKKLQESEQAKQEQKASFESEIKNLNARNSDLALNLVTAQEGLKTLQESLQESEEQKRVIQRDDAVAKLRNQEEQLLKCTKEEEQLQKTVKELEGKIQGSVASNNELRGTLDVMAAQKGRLQEENKSLETIVKTLQVTVAELQKSVEHATVANGQLAQKLTTSEEENRNLEGKIASLEESLVSRANDSLRFEQILNEATAGLDHVLLDAQRHREEHDLRMELERLRNAEEESRRRVSMIPEDPSSSSESIVVDPPVIHDNVDEVPEFEEFVHADPQEILSDVEADEKELDEEDVELSATVDAGRGPQEGYRRDALADEDAPSTSRRAGRGLGKNNNDAQAKKIREEKEEMERKVDQEKNDRKRRYEDRERAGTSGSSYQPNRRRRTVAGVEKEREAGGGPPQDRNLRSRSEERLAVQNDADFDMAADFEGNAGEESDVVRPGRRGRKPGMPCKPRKQRKPTAAIEANKRRYEEKKKEKKRDEELKKMFEDARNYSGSPELTD
ncbi:unnamed protein product [Caenorhabditis nigoni]